MGIKHNIEKHRDGYTKLAFIRYLETHSGERFFQALRNFCGQYMINDNVNFVGISEDGGNYKDTFYIECDRAFSAAALKSSKEPTHFVVKRVPNEGIELSIFPDFLFDLFDGIIDELSNAPAEPQILIEKVEFLKDKLRELENEPQED